MFFNELANKSEGVFFTLLLPWILYHDEAKNDTVDAHTSQLDSARQIARRAAALARLSRWWYLLIVSDEDLWRTIALEWFAATSRHVEFRHFSWRNTVFSALLGRPVPDLLSWNDVLLPPSRIAALWRSHVDCSAFFHTPLASAIVRIDANAPGVVLDAKLLAKFHRQPMILLPSAVAAWPAVRAASWTIERLVERFGDVEFNVQSPDDNDDVRMRFADYVAYARAQHDETPLYVFDRKFHKRAPALLDEYSRPALFGDECDLLQTLDARIRPTLRWLVIGPPRTGASWHRDPLSTSAWNTLLEGRKRWAIYPPYTVPPGVEVEYDDAGNPTDWQSPSTVFWFAHIYPTLAPHQRPYIECVQMPHETIYVPAHWWHCVLNLDLNVAVTENFGEEAYAGHVIESIRDLKDDESARKRHMSDEAAAAADAKDEVPFDKLVAEWIAGTPALARADVKSDNGDENDGGDEPEDEEERATQRATRFRGDFERLCKAGGVTIDSEPQVMVYGQNPVFVLGKRVVKLVQPRFVDSLERERSALRLLAGQSDAFLPLLASGLEPCPFVVTSLVENAVPLRAVATELSLLDEMRLATWCAQTLSVLRDCSPVPSSETDRERFRSSVQKWRAHAPHNHALSATLPAQLVAEVPLFVAKHLPTVGDNDWRLIHGDVNDENVLMRRGDDGRWRAATLIDFGDSFVAGDLRFELQALYISTFRCERALMASFAAQFDAAASEATPNALMAYALIHPCDPLATVFRWRPELLLHAGTLDALAISVFALQE
jgi:hypothetical protein